MAQNPFFATGPALRDPFERFDEIDRMFSGKSRRKQAAIQPLDPEEEDSLLGQIGGKTLSAVGYLGSILDKPGRAIRGALSGNAREALAFLPLSDTVGITDPEQAVGGRDLLEQWGVLDKNTEGLDSGDVAGFAAEMALDPLTYLGGLGALGKGAKAVKASGLLKQVPKVAAAKVGRKVGAMEARQLTNLADIAKALPIGPSVERGALMNALVGAKGTADDFAKALSSPEPLGGLSTLGLPFMGPGKVIGTGERAQKVAAKLDALSAAARASTPAKFVTKLFHPEARQAATLEGQQRAIQAAQEGTSAQAHAAVPIAQLEQRAHELGVQDDPEFWGGVRQMVEQTKRMDLHAGMRGTAQEAQDFLAKHAANPSTASVPVMITKAMKQKLSAAGFDAAAISNMTPAEAWQHLGGAAAGTITPELKELLKQTGFARNLLKTATPAEALKHLDDYVKSVPAAPAIPTPSEIEALAFPGRSPEHLQFGREAAKIIGEQDASVLEAGKAIGLGYELNDHFSQHMHRQTPGSKGTGAGGQTLQTSARALRGREDFYKNIPRTDVHAGGTSSINQMMTDPEVHRLAQIGKNETSEYILKEYLDLRASDSIRYRKLLKAKEAKQLIPGSPDAYELEALAFHHKQADYLAEKIPGMRSEVQDQGGLFVRNVFADQLQGQMGVQMAVKSGEAVHGLLADVADKALMEGVPVEAAYKRRKLGTMGTGLRGPAAYKAFAEQLVERGKEQPSILMALANPKTQAAAIKTLKSYKVPLAHLTDASRIMEFQSTPKALEGFFGMWDKLTSSIKNHLTVPFPSFWSRNLVSLMWQDAISGGISNPFSPTEWKNFATNWHDSMKMLKGETIEGMSELPLFAGQNLSDREATKLFRSHSFAHKISPHSQGEAMQTVGGAAYDAGDFSHDIPGLHPRGIKSGFTKTVEDVRNGGWGQLFPWKVRGGLGGGDAKKLSEFAPPRIGERANSYIESVGRNATFLRELRKGTAPDVAAAISHGAHVDYAALSSFERQTMQRLFPFYSYSRRMIPWQLRQLAERPGGPTAQAIRLSRESSESEPFAPSQVAGGVAIPLGDQGNGLRRYLTTDLPHESMNDLLSVRPTVTGTVQHSGMALASQLHPFLKAPAEIIAGKSFFQKGRPLTELHSPTATGNVLLDQALTNSPASRYLSSFGTLSQPAERKSIWDKAVNMLAGVHLHDIDTTKAKNAAIRDVANELLRGSKNVHVFEDLYMSPEQMAEATPEQIALFRLLKTMSQRSRDQKQAAEKPAKDAAKRRKELLK